jgi:hypothetical protein
MLGVVIAGSAPSFAEVPKHGTSVCLCGNCVAGVASVARVVCVTRVTRVDCVHVRISRKIGPVPDASRTQGLSRVGAV